ncbi:hypothetical protein D3C85_496120 [compost metagenome]
MDLTGGMACEISFLSFSGGFKSCGRKYQIYRCEEEGIKILKEVVGSYHFHMHLEYDSIFGDQEM